MLNDFIGRYATLTHDTEMRRTEIAGGTAVVVSHTAPAGATVKVVSFFLDGSTLGVTDTLEGELAPGCRLAPEELAHLRATPDAAPARARCDACGCEGLIRMRCRCGRVQCDECTLDDELWSGLCIYCQPRGGVRQ